MGYFDAVCNLFSDFYRDIELKVGGKKPEGRRPDFAAGYAEMRVLEAAIQSRKNSAWVKVPLA